MQGISAYSLQLVNKQESNSLRPQIPRCKDENLSKRIDFEKEDFPGWWET